MQQAVSVLTEEQFKEVFQGFDACFVLFDTKHQNYIRFNQASSSVQLSPCSTFKIFNSLAGLDTGVLRDENHPITWDGTKYDIADWNGDQTLQSAVRSSVVWYFQRVASEIGEARMKELIAKAHYGNQDTSGGITNFWLGSTLKISCEQQVDFIKGLINDELPFSKRSMAIVRGLLKLDRFANGTLYGKTGSNFENGKMILGWFVGYLALPNRTYIFATNIRADDDAWGIKARALTEKLLSMLV